MAYTNEELELRYQTSGSQPLETDVVKAPLNATSSVNQSQGFDEDDDNKDMQDAIALSLQAPPTKTPLSAPGKAGNPTVPGPRAQAADRAPADVMRDDWSALVAAGLPNDADAEIVATLSELQLHEGDLQTLPTLPATGVSILDFKTIDRHVSSNNSQVRLWKARRKLSDLAVKYQTRLADGPDLASRLKKSARALGSMVLRQFKGTGQRELEVLEKKMKTGVPAAFPTGGKFPGYDNYMFKYDTAATPAAKRQLFDELAGDFGRLMGLLHVETHGMLGKPAILGQFDGILEWMKEHPEANAFDALAKLKSEGESCFLDICLDFSALADQKEALERAIKELEEKLKEYEE
jgi:hypothetical protein